MIPTNAAVCEKIRRAFQDVKLGNGIGLAEAEAVDAYADETIRKACRARDERENWQRIPQERLMGAGLCFTDAEGMRFHLPAYMLATLNHGPGFSPVFMLQQNAPDLFVLFTPEQRETVRDFLRHLQNEPAYAREHEAIASALAGHWRET